MADIRTLQNDIHRTAQEHGFWEASQNIGEKLALIHSELSEALEEYRDGSDLSAIRFIRDGELVHGWEELDPRPKPEGFAVELADAVIRIMDLCGYLGIDLEAVLVEKMAYNKTREYLHGRTV